MSRSDSTELVDAYWRQYRLSTSDSRPERLAAADSIWATDEVEAIVAGGGAGAVRMIEDLADAVAGDVGALAYLGAGPVEDLLRHNGPPDSEAVDALDAAARRNGSVQAAVRCVWWSDDDDPELALRFKRFGPPL